MEKNSNFTHFTLCQANNDIYLKTEARWLILLSFIFPFCPCASLLAQRLAKDSLKTRQRLSLSGEYIYIMLILLLLYLFPHVSNRARTRPRVRARAQRHSFT